MRTGRPLASLSVSEQDRLQLVGWTKRPKTAQALAMRSRIVLLAAEGNSNKVIAARLHTIPRTVGKWRRRYLEFGLDGLLNEPRHRPILYKNFRLRTLATSGRVAH